MTTQIAVKLPDHLVARLDDLVAAGAFASRSQAVRQGLELALAAHHRADVDRAFAEGYRRLPETAEELAGATRLALTTIADEPWDRWW